MNILIVDDDPLVCQSLRLLLSKESDMEVTATASDGESAIACCRHHAPDIVLMDIRMPGMDGIQATRLIKSQWPAIKIMMLTTFKDEHNIRLALLAGAEGYLIKSLQVAAMAEQLRLVVSGSSVLDPDALRNLVHPNAGLAAELTHRERDIVELVAHGCSNREIASQLFIGEGTVRNMLSTVLDKLEVRDRTQLAIYYWRKQTR